MTPIWPINVANRSSFTNRYRWLGVALCLVGGILSGTLIGLGLKPDLLAGGIVNSLGALLLLRNPWLAIPLQFVLAGANDLQGIASLAGLRPNRFIALVFLLAWALRRQHSPVGQPLKGDKLFLTGIPLVALYLIAALRSHALLDGIIFTATSLSYLIMYYAIITWRLSWAQVKIAIYALLASSFLPLAFLFLQYSGQSTLSTFLLGYSGVLQSDIGIRIMGSGSPNETAQLLLPPMFMALAMSGTSTAKTSTRVLLMVTAILCGLGILLTGSSAVMLASGVGWLLYVSLLRMSVSRRVVLTLFVALLFVGTAVQMGWTPDLVVTKLVQLTPDTDLRIARGAIYADFFRLIRENPLLGAGYNNYLGLIRVIGATGQAKSPHDNYLAIAADAGLLAAAVFVYIQFLWIKAMFSDVRGNLTAKTYPFRLGIFCGVTALFVVGLFHTNWAWSYLWILMGLGINMTRRNPE